MHQALYKVDVLHEIFSHLLWDDPTNTMNELNQKQAPGVASILLNCALTCQSFREPALDKLWWRIDRIRFLFQLLPSFQLFCNGTYFLDGPILDADWTIFDRYARRIYGLHDIYTSDYIDPSVFIQISQGRKGIPFLPSLRYLSTGREGSELLVFLLPSVRWLSCQPPSQCKGFRFYPSIWALITGLTQVAPGLQSLILQLPLSENCLDSITNFKSLRHLSFHRSGGVVTPVEANFFAKLSSLENLTSLGLVGLANSTLSRYSSISAYFPMLETLTVSSTIAQMIPLLRIAKFQHLKFFSYTEEIDHSIVVYEGDMEDQWRILLQLLRQNTNKFLESVSISRDITNGHGPHHNDDDDYDPHIVGVHGISAFPDLLQLKLGTFIISSQLFISLSNPDIQHIADAWPSLRILHLTTCFIEMDFHALIEVAKRLPLLDELHIPINAQSLPSFDSIPLLSHRLQSLNVTKSLVKDSATFARCVDRVFPNLKTFEGGHGSCSMLWDQVKTLIPYFQGARQDEKLRNAYNAVGIKNQ